MTRGVKALLLSREKTAQIGTRSTVPGGSGYTQRIIDTICRDHGIEERFRGPLAEQLEAAQRVYMIRAGNAMGRLNNRKIRQRLAVMERHAAKLRDELKNLHPQIFRECVSTYRELREDEMRQGPQSRVRRAGIEARLPEELYDFREIPALLELVFATARRQLVPDAAGKTPDDVLGVWVKMMSDFWVRVLEREYTFDSHQGIPVTDAGRFLVDCLMPVDPPSVFKISSQMRRYIEEK